MTMDAVIRKDVEAELEFDPVVNNLGIAVVVRNGVVTLAGHVPTYADKWAAERATKNVAGVRAIVNEIDVKPVHPRSDQQIATTALHALEASALVPATVSVLIENGWITLEGRVQRWYQKNAAEQALHSLKGVRGLTNKIVIELDAHIDARDIRNKIHAAFARHAALDAGRVMVSVVGDAVTLSGVVRSWYEREDAEAAAWAAPGVRRVKNELSLSQ